jgi:L-seryl-tRNA(Ser) seleniumtransferase
MSGENTSLHAALPSVDRVIRFAALRPMIERYGRVLVTEAVREVLAEFRTGLSEGGRAIAPSVGKEAIIQRVAHMLNGMFAPSLGPVRNLTGTVLHTNLGRSPLPQEAITAMTVVASGAANVEYDLDRGRRGDRDSHVEGWLLRLTGAAAATVVNNNAAAVLLVLNSLALRREVIVSRGELIEIGDAFRLPDIMARAGCRLHEVGTTNRTHAADYENAVSSKTGLILKAHTSNYAVQGFTAAVGEKELAGIAGKHGLPLVVDLGSGTLVPLTRYGLPEEPTVSAMLNAGADLVTFSGDKLLGGPQAGIIVGCKDLVARIKRNPLKRALRVDKITLAALGALLPLYADPDRLANRLPALRLLTRPEAEIRSLAERLAPVVADRLDGIAVVTVESCMSQVGSGALPLDTLPSAALAITPVGPKKKAPQVLRDLTAAFRSLPTPVIGRIHDGRFLLDMRCLEDEEAFARDVATLALNR